MTDADSPSLAASVPLFPLPNVVLFPGAVLALHIFEERYKEMTRDALASRKLIAMALLKPGWEKTYYQNPAVELTVCVGKILTSESFPDGKFNFLLQGLRRAQISSELTPDPYRRAHITTFLETAALEIDLEPERARIHKFFTRQVWDELVIGHQFRDMTTTDIATSQIADLIAFNFLEDTALKQSLLADPDVRRRIQRTLDALESTVQIPTSATPRPAGDPSMN